MIKIKGGVGGMEYPGLIMITSDEEFHQFSKDDEIYFTTRIHEVVSHEIAHQWFYGIVGNDEVNEPWLDESYANFSEKLYFKEAETEDYDMGKIIDAYCQLFSEEALDYDKSLLGSIYDFDTGYNQKKSYIAIYYLGG